MATNYLTRTTLSLVALMLLSGSILMSSSTSAENVVDEINITVPVSCSLSGTGMTSHTATIENGRYVSDIGTTTLKAFCNDNNGFAIYATGYTGDTLGNNKLIGSNTSSEIVTGTATTAGSPDVSNWAMKLETNSSATYALTLDNGFGSYSNVPSSYTKVAHRDSGTDLGTSAEGATLTSTYAAYIAKTQPADSYQGQVIYTLVHPSSAAPSVLTPPTSCTTPVPGLKYMQDLASSNKATILSNMTEDSQYYLADKRDDKTYCVAKLKDGNLWMTQNLDHDIKTDGRVIYDNTTTDLGWNGTSYSTASWTPASATKATNDTTWNTGSTGDTTPESYDPGELYWNGVPMPQNQSDCEAAGGSWESAGDSDYCSSPTLTSPTGNSHYHLGNFYNWTAAIAMNDSGSYITLYADANQSVCPAGWTLPKSGNNTSSGSFEYLFTQYGWNSNSYMMENPNIWNTAIKLPLAGYWYGSLYSTGYDGGFWSSVIYDSSVAYNADVFYYGGVYPDNNGNGSETEHGHPVRCVAR